MGDGWVIGGAMYTLNGTEVHAVCYDPVLVYDARGNGGGAVCPTITGEHQNRITDYTAIVVHPAGECTIPTQPTDTENLKMFQKPCDPSTAQGVETLQL